MNPQDDAIQETQFIPLSPEAAFRRLTEEMMAWWPKGYSWAGNQLTAMGIPPAVGGLCYEVGAHGFTLHWGRVLACTPPSHLHMLWQINGDRTPEPNAGNASELTFDLRPEHGATQLRLTHRHFHRHGKMGDALRAGLASEHGWRYLLEQLADV